MSIKRHQPGNSSAPPWSTAAWSTSPARSPTSHPGFKGQTEQVLKKIDAILAAAGRASRRSCRPTCGDGHPQTATR